MQHILINGRNGVGKSTLIRALLQSIPAPVYGVITKKEVVNADGFYPVYIHRYGTEQHFSPDNLIGLCGDGKSLAFPETFDRYAAYLREDAGHAGLIVLDELGFLESDAAAFCGTVLDLLDGDIPVLAAVKPKDTPFLAAVRHHPKAEIFTVNESNRDALAGQVLAFLRGQLN